MEYASSLLDNVNVTDPNCNTTHPTILASKLHSVVVNFFSQKASKEINNISRLGQQTTLMGDGQADYNYCTSGPLFLIQKKRVTLITDSDYDVPDYDVPVNGTVYGNRSSQPTVFSPWSVDVGLLKFSGMPSICLGLQVRLSSALTDPDENEVSCKTLFDFGDADIPSIIKDCDSSSTGTALSVGQYALYSRPGSWGVSKVPILSFIGLRVVKGGSTKASGDYNVTSKNE